MGEQWGFAVTMPLPAEGRHLTMGGTGVVSHH